MTSPGAIVALVLLAQPGQTAEAILEGAFSGALRAAILQDFSAEPPTEFSNNWGNQITVRTPDGGHWEWEGLRSHWVTHYREDHFNHGLWTRGWVRIENAPQETVLNVSDFRTVPGHFDISFAVFVRTLFRGHVEAREYNHGVELLGVDSDMRAVGKMTLRVRVYLYQDATRLGWDVIAADLNYSDVTVDRIGAVSGYAAKLLGDAATGTINQFFSAKRDKTINQAKAAVSSTLSGSLPIRDDVARVIRMLSH
jgi:hypothetical protein